MDKTRPIIWMIDSLGPGGAEQLMPTILKNLKQAGFNIPDLRPPDSSGQPDRI